MVLILCMVFLFACGKMPGQVDPPSGVSEEIYRQVYPNPSLEPQAELHP